MNVIRRLNKHMYVSVTERNIPIWVIPFLNISMKLISVSTQLAPFATLIVTYRDSIEIRVIQNLQNVYSGIPQITPSCENVFL